tara:strand:+ start:1271 stop:1921 length:651 start_codon:yes stop_codon:yes gene_type:complete
MKCVAYLRKSTQDKQVNSLQTQRREIELYAKQNDVEIINWFEEAISGTIKERPEWKKALSTAQKNKCPIIAKSLSRIGRNASQVLQIIEDVELVITDMGQNIDANLLGMIAIVNQIEVKNTASRTRQSLAYLKSQGVKLGTPDWKLCLPNAWEQNKSKANAYALTMEGLIMNDHSQNQMAKILNEVGLKTRRGKAWTNVGIGNLRKRILKLRQSAV